MIKLFIILAEALKFGKVGGTVITMLIALAVYAQLYGWRYAAGFIGLIFVHEMGHFIAVPADRSAVRGDRGV